MELLESSESLGAWNYTQDAIKLLEKRLTDFSSSRERTKQQKKQQQIKSDAKMLHR